MQELTSARRRSVDPAVDHADDPPVSHPTGRALRGHWLLEDGVTFLNHGAFGACPRPVLESQRRWRERMERNPVRFLARELEGLLEGARAVVAEEVGGSPEDLAFVRNATSGVNAVLRSLELSPEDELLVTNHGYPACRNAVEHVAKRSGAHVAVARLPFPGTRPDTVVEAILAAVSPRTRLAVIDHVTSPTALVLPVARIVAALAERGIDTLVDGAHAPGMLPLDLSAIGAAYYVGNFHKWCCAPKGAAMLWVRRDRQGELHPAVISHGYASERGRSRFLEEFDWTGTDDPSAWLTVPDALVWLASRLPGGLPAVAARNRALVLEGRRIVCEALGIDAPAPPEMIGSLAAVLLPGHLQAPPSSDALRETLASRHAIEVPVFPWPAESRRIVRLSAHLYNEADDYQRLAEALAVELGDPD